MKLKSALLKSSIFFLALVVNNILQSQPINLSVKIENQHVEFVNKLTDSHIKTQNYLLKLYVKLENSRQQLNFTHIGKDFTCAKFVEEKKLNELLANTSKSEYALELKKHAQSLYDRPYNIDKLSTELEICIRIGNYEKDKITNVSEKLESKGQTNFCKGSKLAYKTAKLNFTPYANNRLISASNGTFLIDNKLCVRPEKDSENKTPLSVFAFGGKDKEIKIV